MMRILGWVVIPVAIIFGLYSLYRFDSWVNKSTPSITLTEREEQCFKVAIVDEAGSDLEAQVHIARAIKNHAAVVDGVLKICDVYENFRLTMAPTQPTSDAKTPRYVDSLDWYQWTAHRSRQIAAAAIVERVKKGDPTLWDEKKYPWYTCLQWITRAPRIFHAWENTKLMEEETVVVFETKMGTKFRCLKPPK